MTENRQYTGLDLFSGIGGFTLAMQANQIKPIAFSEIDKHAIETYNANFDHESLALGDITKIEARKIPAYDLLTGGFPCQSFSMLGHKRGFDDVRGTLFFHLARMIAETRPRWFILENVQGLTFHDHGKTLQTILNLLGNVHNGQELLPSYVDHLGYIVDYRVLNSLNYGLPQSRPRIFIVGRRSQHDRFRWPDPQPRVKLSTILESSIDDWFCFSQAEYDRWKKYREISHFAGDCYEAPPEYAPTITAGYNKTRGNAIKFYDPSKHAYRILTVRECLRCQGFPDHFIPHKNKNIAYKQVGNSIPIKVASLIMGELVKGASQQ